MWDFYKPKVENGPSQSSFNDVLDQDKRAKLVWFYLILCSCAAGHFSKNFSSPSWNYTWILINSTVYRIFWWFMPNKCVLLSANPYENLALTIINSVRNQQMVQVAIC